MPSGRFSALKEAVAAGTIFSSTEADAALKLDVDADFAVILTLPAFFAVIIPEPDTAAIDSFEERKDFVPLAPVRVTDAVFPTETYVWDFLILRDCAALLIVKVTEVLPV